MNESAYNQAVEIAKAAIQAKPDMFLKGSQPVFIKQSAQTIADFIEQTALHLEAVRERLEKER
ncbi:Uncharacterised protein [Kingella potus]|uniref:Uncharacterized protein n=1 Tax=Kingella potus TaxID=265175 RepID=A0A377QYE5_9NEIS|nr:hypothetical protein [Kingella potus]UOP00553.1 hypothetical protein LVJ84_12045 [Kingella potus]UOP01993.1 hypothetical protein LVJ84_14560 [Kingella potus]STQ99825.1 Uncharacterised protein [Kingella potus]STR03052.1 Uncharacterised protein [Kingella potus]STR03056.1 Uncharacterised protein [Kingella potus]